MAQVRQQNIVGRWCPSAGATGFRLIDRSGRGNHGTLTNMDPASDWVVSGGKGALDFDGSNDYMAFAASDVISFAGTDPFSVSVWMFNPTGAFSRAVAKTATNGAQNQGWYVGTGSGPASAGKFSFLRGSSSGNDFIQTTSNYDWRGWNHIFVSYNGSTVRMAVNGVLDAVTGTSTRSIATTGNTPFYFAASEANTANQFWSLTIDDVTIFNTALTPNEAAGIYRRGRGYGIGASPHRSRRSAAGFKAYWARRQSQLIGGGV